MPAALPIALVTGAARRIGRAIALDLAGAGWAVAAHYGGSADEAAALVREIGAAGGRAVALQADLAAPDIDGLVDRTAEALGPPTLLVNNAARFEADDAASVTADSWDGHLHANLRAPALLARRFAELLPAEAEGNIVNLVDQRVWNLTPFFLSYTVSKAGLWTLTQTLAMALAPRIRVNAIGPGPVLPSPRQTPEQFERQCSGTLLGRGASPAEICAALRFILEQPSMTGQMIALDGGQHLGWPRPRGAASE